MYSRDFVKKHGGTIFHLPEWTKFLEFVLRGKTETITTDKGVLPVFRGSSLPLSDYCGPLGEIDLPGDVEIFSLEELDGAIGSPFVTFDLDVKGKDFEEILKKAVHQKHRNMVNRAENDGIQVYKFESDKKHLKAYYKLYVKTMQGMNRIPLPKIAFEKLAELFQDEMELYLAQKDGEFIGGLLVFVFNKRMHIWGNASKKQFRGVNNALYAFAIQRACKRGLYEVDFGSTLKGSSHYKFKHRWGGRELPIWYRGDNCPDGKSGLLAKLIALDMKFLPASCVSLYSRILHKIK